MPKYKSTSSYIRKYGLDLNNSVELETYVILPTPDPDVIETDPSPVWLPVLMSGSGSLGAGGTSDIQVPISTVPIVFRIRITGGNLNIYFNDFTSTPLRLTSGDVFTITWDKHYVWNLRFEGGAGGGSYVYNIYEHRPRDGQSWR